MPVVLFASLNIFPLLSKKINWERKDLTITKLEKMKDQWMKQKTLSKKKWLKFCSGMSSLPLVYFFFFVFLTIFYFFYCPFIFFFHFETLLFFKQSYSFTLWNSVSFLCPFLSQTQMQPTRTEIIIKKDTVLQVSSQTRKRDFSVGLTTYPFQI